MEENNKIKTILIDSGMIETNDGQIQGVPANPRMITNEKMEALKGSIQEFPDMLSMRELLVYPFGEKYVVLGGNMRFKACLSLGYTKMPCKVIPSDTPAEKLRAIVMQDNNQFGSMDWDMVASDWDIEELVGWSVDIPEEWELNLSDLDDSFSLPDGEKKRMRNMTFTLSNEQAEFIEKCLNGICVLEENTFGNVNKNGNSLYEIVRQWEGLKK